MSTTDWRVLLIGGNSGAGKTYLAQKLVQRLSIPFIMVDDVRIALQQMTTPQQQPDLHAFLTYEPEQWNQPETILKDWVRVAQAMVKPLQQIIAHHVLVESSGRLILEGDGILPILATQRQFEEVPGFAGFDIPRKVRAVFLIDDDKDKILANLRQRGRGIYSMDETKQTAFAQASEQFGQWLAREAKNNLLPVLSAQSNETVVRRVLEAIW